MGWWSTQATMKNKKTFFLLLLLFLTIHLAFASNVKKHGSRGHKERVRPLVPGKGAAGFMLTDKNGKLYLGSARKGKKPLKTSPATLENKRLPPIHQDQGRWAPPGPKKWKPHGSSEWASNEETWTTTPQRKTWTTPRTPWTTPRTTWTTPRTTWTTPTTTTSWTTPTTTTTWTTPRTTKWKPHVEMDSSWTTPGKKWHHKPTPKKWNRRDHWNNSLRKD